MHIDTLADRLIATTPDSYDALLLHRARLEAERDAWQRRYRRLVAVAAPLVVCAWSEADVTTIKAALREAMLDDDATLGQDGDGR